MVEKKQVSTLDNFNSTAELASNPGFKSTISIASKDVSDEKAYNPFEHRQVEHPNSTFGSVLHLLKACLGSGILAMPAAFKNSGLVVGTIGTLFAGFICTHTVDIIVRTSQEVCVDAKKPLMGFAETCGAAFSHGPKSLRPWGPAVKNMVDFSMGLTYFSILCVYVVFIGTSFKETLDVYFPELQLSIQVYCALTLVPLVLLGQIRNLKYLVPCSAIANVLITIVFGITMYFMLLDLPPLSERDMVANVSQWPLFFSTVIFAMEGVGVVMPIANEMKDPQHFLGCPGVLNISMVIVICLYGFFGFLGYVQYGDAVQGSVTLNLPSDYIVAQSAKLLMALVIYFSYALQMYVPMDVVTRLLNKRQSDRYENVIQVGIRTVMVLASVCIAAAFPNLELVISLVGAIFFSTLGLLIPAVVESVYRWDRDLGWCKYVRLVKNVVISIIALLALVSGSYVSIKEMLGKGHEVEVFKNDTLMV